MSNEEDDGGRDDITKNFKTQFRSVLQNISGIMIPLILLANIDISKLMVAIMPSLVTLIFLVYDYYQEIKKTNDFGNIDNKYVILVKDKQELEDYQTNQLYRDIEYYINKKIMDKGMKSSLIDENVNLNYVRNNYYDYYYNLKLPEKQFIEFDYKGEDISIYKDILASTSNGNSHLRALRIVADRFDTIKKFLEDCQETYKEYVNSLEKVTYHFYRYNNDTKKWVSKELKTIKNYENVILPIETEDQIKGWIKSFNESKDMYAKKGIPYKMGLLFHGIPGCGKTSLTYAIAYETNRNIYQVPLSSSVSCEELKNIIETIPEGNIVLFEEVDTCSFFKKREFVDDDDATELYKQIQKHKNKQEEYENINADDVDDDSECDDDDDDDEGDNETSQTKAKKISNINVLKIKEEFKKFTSKSKSGKMDMNMTKPDNIFTSYIQSQTFHLLEILDGYNYLYDNIVIMYTNYLDKIDNAIIRPGRIDHKIKLGHANLYQIKKAYNLFYEQDINDDIAQMIADRKITTSFLINTCIIPCINDMKKSVDLALTENKY
jgi:hypothetical protein